MPGGGVVHVPVGWLREFVELPATLDATSIAEVFSGIGLEVESIASGADQISGPLLVGRVLEFAAEPQRNGKTIRWCQVDVGEDEPRGIVCGAANFVADDLVVVALPGSELPGGFAISARKTYGHISDGMICSVRELGSGEDHDGILVLPPDNARPGDDAVAVLDLADPVIELAVTPDRGYCLSIRGLARELATALETPYRDIANAVAVPEPNDGAHPVRIQDPAGCPVFSLRAVSGLDPTAPSPEWMRRRLRQAHMRPISLAVDITNYVMLETGQPLHAYAADTIRGPIVVRRARPGEKLTTLDGQVRELDPDDLLITDDSGPIGLAGVMGGQATEIEADTAEVLLEGAAFAPPTIAAAVRRHRLPSEAAKRFERGVDPSIAGVALQRCVDLLTEFGGAVAGPGYTRAGEAPMPSPIELAVDRPARLIGMPVPSARVVLRLRQVGCGVDDREDPLVVTPPSWRPDLTDPAGLVEEIARLEGYANIPSTLPAPPAGRGLTAEQRLRQAISRSLGYGGYTEVLSWPFAAADTADRLGLAADDPRRRAVRLANPLSETEPELRTALLPGLLQVLARNVGRGNRDLALYEIGLVFRDRPGAVAARTPGVAERPSQAQIAALDAGLPAQPRHVAVALGGDIVRKGWDTAARPADWTDAIAAAQTIARVARVQFDVRAAEVAPWHPGRCAELLLNGVVVGHAGELHPRVISELGLPPRTCAAELDLDQIAPPVPARGPLISSYPPVLLDLALVVPAAVASAVVRDAVRDGAGALLESLRLFDVYTDEALRAAGEKSLAFALRFRAADRTLTVEEATAARDAAIAVTAERAGARLRE